VRAAAGQEEHEGRRFGRLVLHKGCRAGEGMSQHEQQQQRQEQQQQRQEQEQQHLQMDLTTAA